MITLSNIAVSFGTRTLFDSLTLALQEHDRIGLVGPNGYGKSTLLKVIAGTQPIDSGTISIMNGKRIAYLNQDIVIFSDLDVREFITQESLKDPFLHNEVPAHLYAKADKIVRGLGFGDELLQKPINTLSGGWKMRVVLAQLLLLDADFYLFDEPTNHLDIVAKDWFLQFLCTASFGFLLVCHEKYFLNKLCTKIVALDTAAGTLYQGNYDTYVQRREQDLALLHAAYVQQQKMIAQKKETIARFRASASRASLAQSMIKELESLTLITLPNNQATMHIPLPAITRSGIDVLTVEKLAGGYDTQPALFRNVSLSVQRGEKIVIIAANGVGKTTLLHTIAGILPACGGTVNYGHNVTSAVFYQEQSKMLNAQDTIWESVTAMNSTIADATIRSMLGCFLFSGDDIYKKIAVLSGGEKNRVGLMRVLVQQANLLLLDEPTNHLDMQSKEVLLKTLQKYEGTLLFVSHDHDFINQLATSVIELTPHGAYTYRGNYDDYRYQKKMGRGELPVQKKAQNSITPPTVSVNTNERNKKVRSIEHKTHTITQKIAQLKEELEQYLYGTIEFTSRYERLITMEKEEKELLEQWMELQE